MLKIGDVVRILAPTSIDSNGPGWVGSMTELIGEIDTIKDIDTYDHIKLSRASWRYEESWLELVSLDVPEPLQKFTKWADDKFGPAPNPECPQELRFQNYYECWLAALDTK